jgi:hypothetical protein
MQFIDMDTHFFIEDVYKDLSSRYKDLAPQFVWKSYQSKPNFWDKTWGKETYRDTITTSKKYYKWEGQRFLCDENGYHDVDIFPGNAIKDLISVREGIEKKLCFDATYGGPFRGDLNYDWEGERNLKIRKKDLDALGIDKNIINPYNYMLGLNYRIDTELAISLGQAWNNKIQNLCRNEDRFWPVIWVPFQNKDMKFNLKMIEDGLENGAIGVTMGEHFTYSNSSLGRMWGMCEWMEPFWKHAHEYQYPVFFHALDCWYDNLKWMSKTDTKTKNKWLEVHKELLPLISSNEWDPSLKDKLVPGFLSTPFSLYKLSFASLIVGGVLDRYPNLRLIWAERGISWILPTLNILSKILERDCSVYLKNWSFICDPEWDNFAEDANKIGYDHLLFSTDYPHNDPSGRNRDNDISCIMSLDTDHINKEKIANINAKKLFNKTMFK